VQVATKAVKRAGERVDSKETLLVGALVGKTVDELAGKMADLKAVGKVGSKVA